MAERRGFARATGLLSTGTGVSLANSEPSQGSAAGANPGKAQRWALALGVALAAALSAWLWWGPGGSAGSAAQEAGKDGEKLGPKAAGAPLAPGAGSPRAPTVRPAAAPPGTAAALLPSVRTPTAEEDARAKQLLGRELRRAVALRAFADQAQALLRPCAPAGPGAAATPFQVTFRRDAGKGQEQVYHAVDLRPAAGAIEGRSRGCVEALRSVPLQLAPGDLAEDELFTATVALAVAMAAER